MADPDASYLPGYKPAHIRHHEWRTAENSAAYLLPALEAMRRQNPQLKMLDVGAGPGTMSASFAQHIPDGHVTATDISDEVLGRARDHARSLGLTNMSFQEANVFQLPFPDDTFDVAHAHQVLCHLQTPVPAIREMLRVTRPGGVVALRESDTEMWSFWPASPALLKWHRMLLALHNQDGRSTTAGRQLLSWALAAGAERGNVKVSCGTWCYSAPEDKKAWEASMVARIVSGPSREKALEIKAATEEELEEMIAAWHDWVEAPDAVQALVNGEVLIKK